VILYIEVEAHGVRIVMGLETFDRYYLARQYQYKFSKRMRPLGTIESYEFVLYDELVWLLGLSPMYSLGTSRLCIWNHYNRTCLHRLI